MCEVGSVKEKGMKTAGEQDKLTSWGDYSEYQAQIEILRLRSH